MTKKGEASLDSASLKRGDVDAFEFLVREFQDMVHACGRTVGLRDDEIEDAASETFMAAYKSIKTFRGKGKLSSWLWRIAYNKAVDQRRRRQAAGTLADDDTMTVAASDCRPGAKLEEDERSRVIWQAVQTLPESQAAAIVLFYREDRSLQEISEMLETPENTVKTWLHRGRNELFTKLKSYQEGDHVQ
jgi:RNA polymerase sigma-70 factor (ECF subfamily)